LTPTAPQIRAVLGVDQADDSGWGIVVPRTPLPFPCPGLEHVAHWGLVRPRSNFEARDIVVRKAIEMAGGDPRQLLVVFEDHSWMKASRFTRDDEDHKAGPKRTTATILGLGGARDRWNESLDRQGHPESCRIAVDPGAWRRRVHGVTKGEDVAIKQAAITWASNKAGNFIANHNVAEGVCLGCFGAVDGVMSLARARGDARVKSRARSARKRQGKLPGVGE
jgi:hypothetical protein